MVNNYTHSNRREKWGIGVLGELLQELRKDKGMTQAELAAKLELSPLTVSSYECGRSAPDDETKVKIAEIFDVSVDYLLGLIREPVSYRRTVTEIILPKTFRKMTLPKCRNTSNFCNTKKNRQKIENNLLCWKLK